MIPLLVVLFVLSGLAGLVYESIWSRYLGLFVGHAAYAQVLVLVIFLGGLSAGAMAVARRSERIANPLRAYAWVEAAVGVLGLMFHPLFTAATEMAYAHWFPALAGSGWLVVVKWSVASLLILPQSVLLGATFPLMSAGVLRRSPRHPGRTLALLYFANSLGAAAGALSSGFVLIGAFGLPGTVATAGVLNLVVAATVLFAVRGGRGRAAEPAAGAPAPQRAAGTASRRRSSAPVPVTAARSPASSPAPSFAPAPSDTGLHRLLLAVSFGTAVASFFYEIAWIRMLSLVLGSTSRSFELMLSAFILGLALGALWVRSRADRFRSPVRALGLLQWAMGSLAMATLPLYVASFQWMSSLVSALPRDPWGYDLFSLARYGICLVVMLPATFCAGTTLPLITRSLLAGGGGERAIGRVYGINTLGSILGAGVAGLVLLPLLGLQRLLVAGALLDIALGVVLLARAGESQSGRRLGRVALAALGLAALVGWFAPFDLHLLTSGVYRSGILPDPGKVHVVSYRDGRTASVSVELYDASQALSLSTNGKADASLRLLWLLPESRRPLTAFRTDESTQVLAALIPLAHAPRARTAVVIGQGSGMTSHTLLGDPGLERVTTVEIEPEMIRASRRFRPANRRVFDDPRARFVLDDAKSFFAAERGLYDLVLSEPSNVWVSGVAGLFSTEFYRSVREHLTPEGVFGQWIHLYESNDDMVLSVIAAIHRNFRSYEAFLVADGDMLIVATNRAAGLTPDWKVVGRPGIAADLGNIPPFTPELFEALRVCDRSTLAPLVEPLEPNSDFVPTLDLAAERARFVGGSAEGFLHLHSDRFSLARLVSGRRVPPIATFAVPAPEIHRLRDLAMSAALRGARRNIDPARIHDRLPAAIARWKWLRDELARGAAPADWKKWMTTALAVEHDWHLGSTGLVDESFHGLLSAFCERHGAPPEARAALRFVHDLATWDLAAAARAAEPVVESATRGDDWLPVELLFDGAVAAHLLSGDARGARSVYRRLEPRLSRDPRDLRTRLLAVRLGMPEAPRR